jgi:uroporphyrinogen-III synthase
MLTVRGGRSKPALPGLQFHLMKSSLSGRRIVITRPVGDAERLANRLRALGAEPIVAPSIEIEFTDPPELDAALAALPRFDWMVFTSRNGVEAVFRLTQRIGGPRIAAIGPATAAALQERGVRADVVPDEYVAEAVLDALGDVRGLRILLPRADIARRALTDGLRARGAEVEEIAAYRTRAVGGTRPRLDGADAVTFTSSSTVRGFLEAGPLPDGAKVVCIGPITARTARESGLTVTAVAAEYTEDGLIAALVAAFDESAEVRS